MPMLTNSPPQAVMRLEQKQSYSLGVYCKINDTRKADLTDCVLTFVMAETARFGGGVVVTQVLDLNDPVNGYARLYLQADDMDLPARQYNYALTILTAEGYTGILVKGECEVQANVDPVANGTFAGDGTANSITLTLQQNGSLHLHVNPLVHDLQPYVDAADAAAAEALASEVEAAAAALEAANAAAAAIAASLEAAGAARLDVGTVNVVPCGDPLVITITGPAGSQLLNMDIPVGGVVPDSRMINGFDLTSDFDLQLGDLANVNWSGALVDGVTTLVYQAGDAKFHPAPPATVAHAHAESDVTGLVADLAAKVPTTRTVSAGTGLTGGGDLSANRSLAADFGTGAGKVTEGNDSRLTNSRTPTAHASTHAAGGSDPVAIDDSQITPITVNDQTGTTYTFVLADKHRVVTCSNASAQTYTVPPNSSVAYPIGTALQIVQKGAGQVTLAPGSGVTLNQAHGLKTSAQWAVVTLLKILTDTWVVTGDTTT